jgi:hypothetical protein
VDRAANNDEENNFEDGWIDPLAGSGIIRLTTGRYSTSTYPHSNPISINLHFLGQYQRL